MLEVGQLLDVIVLVFYVGEGEGDLGELVRLVLVGLVLVLGVVHRGGGEELAAACVDAELAGQDGPAQSGGHVWVE